jgi:hypothetical protein
MTDTYVIHAPVSGFSPADAEVSNHDAILDVLAAIPDVDLVERLIRDDGTAELYFRWDPKADDLGAEVWHVARQHADHIRSAVGGAGLALLNPVNVETRDVAEKASGSRKATASAAGTKREPASSTK